MMGWETPLMARHAAAMCAVTRGATGPASAAAAAAAVAAVTAAGDAAAGGASSSAPAEGGCGLDVLNIGFGLGIVDEALQARRPRSHTIIEAHRDVHAHMLEAGWGDRPGVRIVYGRWQDVLPQLGTFDAIFFDTYGARARPECWLDRACAAIAPAPDLSLSLARAPLSPPRASAATPHRAGAGEYYDDMADLHAALPALLRRPHGVYSFFNGLASDNLFFHLVTSRVVQVELQRLGLETRYERVALGALEPGTWESITSYWRAPAAAAAAALLLKHA